MKINWRLAYSIFLLMFIAALLIALNGGTCNKEPDPGPTRLVKDSIY